MRELQRLNHNLIQSDSFWIRFRKHVSTFERLKKGDQVLVAVSGGLDSMAFLYMLVELDHFRLSIGHVNHHLRKDSNSDKNFVKGVAEDLDIPFFSKNLNPDEMKKGASVEEWARNHRYHKLQKIACENDLKWILTAHHANDQAETVLMNLARQSGISGLRGIAKSNGSIIRLLLPFTRHELQEFVHRHKIPFREDETNSDSSFPRNFLRNEVIKPWENNSHHLMRGITQSVQHFSEWMDSLDYLISEFCFPSVIRNQNHFKIEFENFDKMTELIQIRLIQILMENRETKLWSKHKIETLRSFLRKNQVGNQIQLGEWVLLFDRSCLLGKKSRKRFTKSKVELFPDKHIEFNQYRYKLKTQLMNTTSVASDPDQEWIDWSVLKGKILEIRLWRDGDLFQPLGMLGHQKISDFLINEKVDRFTKENQAVVSANGEIFWVCGHRIADWVKTKPSTIETAQLSRIQLN